MDFFFFSKSNCLSNMSKLTQLTLIDNNFDKEILRSYGVKELSNPDLLYFEPKAYAE